MKAKKILFPLLAFLCMATIFFFSNQTAKKSQSLSDKVAIRVLEVKSEIVKQEVTSTKKNNFIEATRVFIRKSAHFFIYLVLGIFLFCTLKSYNCKHAFLYALLFSFIYACSDEIHQLFIEMRTASIFDVFIDTCGALVGLCFVHFLTRKKYLKVN